MLRNTRLIGPESAATLQQKRDAVEGRPMFQLVRLSQAGRRPGHGASPLVDFVELACLVILFRQFEIGSSH